MIVVSRLPGADHIRGRLTRLICQAEGRWHNPRVTAIFAMAIRKQPRAAGAESAKRGGPYQRDLANHAQSRWGNDPPSTDLLYARIIWFHSGVVAGDLDN